ncbi:MAG: hypothetical protein DRJ52_09130 [Thermoprotei archaeon]|nr:MAG: hypothetical protein DRJ52_09130 [Thermoprotei archaeon]
MGSLKRDLDWLKSKLEQLSKFTEKVASASDVHYEVHSWTPLKLIALMWWIDIYTKIIPKTKKYRANYWYIDLLAGPGTNRIKESGTIILGSPLIAVFFARKPFTRYVFIEADLAKANALKKRLSLLKIAKRTVVYADDCNTIIRELNITASHFLAFIDCEGLDVVWETVERLLRMRSDIIVVFHTQSLRRTLGRAKKGYRDAERLTAFLGDEGWRDCGSAEDLLKLYEKKLGEHRSYVGCLRIRGDYEYDIILACRKGDYVEAWETLKEKYRRITSRDVELALKILKGEVKALDEFLAGTTLEEFFG